MNIRTIIRVGMLSLVALGVPHAAYAKAGQGRYRSEKWEVLGASAAPKLSSIGEDVVRFSTTPALGGRGLIVEVHRKDSEWAIGTVTLLLGHPDEGWTRMGTVAIEMPIADFNVLTRQVDTSLARGEPDTSLPDGGMIVCTDGPGYVTERRKGGDARWLAGSCGDPHPNDEIALLMRQAAKGAVSKWWPDTY